MITSPRLLAVEMRAGPDALMRVLTVLRRRRCVVTSLDFAAPDRHYGGRLVVGVIPPSDGRHRVESWLENLVEVGSVEVLNGLRPPPAGR